MPLSGKVLTEKIVNENNVTAKIKTIDLCTCSKKYLGGGKSNPLGHKGHVKQESPW